MLRRVASDSNRSQSWCKLSVFLLAMLWCLGLILGVVVSSSAGEAFSSLMRLAFRSPVSIVSLLIVTLLPFLLTAVAVFFSKTWLFFPICFLKAFSYGYAMHAIVLSYGTSGWLIQLILIILDSLAMTVLLWLWIRHIAGRQQTFRIDGAVCAAVLLATAFTEYYFVSPFLATLI